MALKFIADVNIEKGLVDFLISKGFDIKWVTEIDRNMTNGRLLEMADEEHRILITNDKDFSEIVFHQKKTAWGIILFRVKGQNLVKKIELLEKLLKENLTRIEKHFVVVTEERFKFIPLEVKI